MYAKAFGLFDIQNSGCIGISQFKDIISNLNIASDPREIESIAESVDLNHDSVIDFEEFVSAMVRHMPLEDEKPDQAVYEDEDDDAELFACFDKNRDGRISQTELEQVMLVLGENLTPEEIKDMMIEADLNRDGYIDFEEFKLLIKR